MRTHLVGGTTLATGLALSLVLVLAAACETTSGEAPEPGAGRGSAAPIGERTAQRFPRPVPRPAPPAPEIVAAGTPYSPPPEAAASARSPAPATSGLPGVHTVAPGENIYDIARAYGIDAYSLAQSNELRPPFDVSEGQVLIVPGSGGSGSGAIASAQGAGEASGFGRPTERPSAPAASAQRDQDRSTAKTPDKQTAALPPSQPDADAPASAEGFVWPVTGRVVSTYGPKGGGRYNDGVNIAAPEGTTVRAAESGVIAYAGNELRGFGRTLLIKHPGGWVTAYAHNSELLVQRGQQVRRGQAVAKVGSTGGVDEPQLHFEIRRNRKAIDPVTLLPRSGATALHGRTEG